MPSRRAASIAVSAARRDRRSGRTSDFTRRRPRHRKPATGPANAVSRMSPPHDGGLLLLDIEVGDAQRVFLDKVATRLHLIAHQAGEQAVGVRGIRDLHLQQRTDVRIERRFPELLGIHFA